MQVHLLFLFGGLVFFCVFSSVVGGGAGCEGKKTLLEAKMMVMLT